MSLEVISVLYVLHFDTLNVARSIYARCFSFWHCEVNRSEWIEIEIEITTALSQNDNIVCNFSWSNFELFEIADVLYIIIRN